MNTQKLKGRIVEKGLTQGDVANRLGISKTALNNKINGKTEFTAREIKALVIILGINDIDAYFFCD